MLKVILEKTPVTVTMYGVAEFMLRAEDLRILSKCWTRQPAEKDLK